MLPGNNGHVPTGPEPVFVMQIALMPDGNLSVTTPTQFQIDSPEKIALATLTATKAQQFLAGLGFPQGKVQAAPPGLRIPRNLKE